MPAYSTGVGLGASVVVVWSNSSVIVPISAGTPVTLTVDPLLEVAETAVTCWSDDADPPLPHPATAAVISNHTPNIKRCLRRNFPPSAKTVSVNNPANAIVAAPSGPGANIDASLTWFKWRNPSVFAAECCSRFHSG